MLLKEILLEDQNNICGSIHVIIPGDESEKNNKS